MPIILGGGIGGLSTAFYLLKKLGNQHQIKLFEASNRFGGWIRTDVLKTNEKVRFEYGPRTIRPKGVKGINTLELCSVLGLSADIIPISINHPAAKNRMLAVNNELCTLPSSLSAAFKTLPPFKKPLAYALIHDMKNKYRGDLLTDDSMYNFIERRFGTEIAKYLISSMICGICAGDAKEISVKFLMKELFDYEQQHGSVTMGFLRSFFKKTDDKPQNTNVEKVKCALAERSKTEHWSIYSLNNGLELLPNKLTEHLKDNSVALNLNAKCESITFYGNSAIVSVNGIEYKTNCLFSSLPSFETGRLLHNQHPQLAKELETIRYVDVAVVNLQFAGNNLLPSPGFGFLVPPSEERPILGCIYDSCCFDMGENTVLTVMMGGKWFRQKFNDNISHAELLEIAIQQIQSILKIKQMPNECQVNVLRNCIPQYVVGHYDRVARISKYIAEHKLPLKLCGSAYDGVGVNDVIYLSKQAVDSVKIV